MPTKRKTKNLARVYSWNVNGIRAATKKGLADWIQQSNAEIIGLPLEVVLTPTKMREALDRLEACDVILIDTAGRGQRDRLGLAAAEARAW